MRSLPSRIPRPVLASLALVIALGHEPARAADPGQGIAGTVTSLANGEPLPYASVSYARVENGVAGKPLGTITDELGKFSIATTSGTYVVKVNLVGYHVRELPEVVVAPGRMTVLQPKLEGHDVKMETIEVTATAIKDTEASILSKRQRESAVQDGISAEQIRKSTDSNAAEVVNRVTGVSLVDNKYVYVRGLGERYSSAQLNGSTVASPEANRRVLPFDIFPAGFVDNIVIQKTYTPDQPGEFGGGVVNMSTLDFPAHRTWAFTLSSGTTNTTTGHDFMTYSGGSRDFLGFDDGRRALPDLVQQLAKDQPIRLKSLTSNKGFTPEEVEAMGEAFNKVWSPTKDTAAPAYNVAGSYGDELDVLGRPLGVMAAATLSNSLETANYHVTEYQSLNDFGELEVLNDFDVNRSTGETLLGGLLNTGWRVFPNHTFSARAMFNRSSEDQVRVAEGPTSDLPTRQTRLRYVERGLFSGSAGMSHELPFLELDWRAEVSVAEQDEPDRRMYNYELFQRDSTAVWELTRRSPSFGFTRTFSELDDVERNYSASVTVPVHGWQLKSGWTLKNKDRDSYVRRLGFRHPVSRPPDFSASPEDLLTDENIGGTPASFRLEELTRPTDAYLAKHDLQAGFLMADIPVLPRLRVTAGARIEDSRMDVVTRSAIVGAEPEIGTVSSTDVLPAMSLRVPVNERLIFRAGYSRTLNRPDLRELTSQEYTDYERDRTYLGNPELEQAKMENWDVRLEGFPSLEETIAMSIFLKNIERPIEYQVYQGTGSGELVRQPFNGELGLVEGIELEARLALGRIWRGLDTFGFSGNLALVHSEAELALVTTRAGEIRRSLTGQSPWTGNLGLQYANAAGTLSAGAQFNTFGDRLDASGPVDEVGNPLVPDIYEKARHTLDLTSSARLGGGRLKLSVENVLGAKYRTAQGTQTAEERELGRTISLSLGYGSR